MIVPPGLSSPARSAASIMGRPMRSLTLPPGLSISSLARTSGWRSSGPISRVTRLNRTSGVRPTRSRIDSEYRMVARIPPRRVAQRARPSVDRPGWRPLRRRLYPPLCRRCVGRSGVAIQAAGPEQEPGESAAQAARTIGWVQRPGVDVLDNRTQPGGERIAQLPREVQLLARPLRDRRQGIRHLEQVLHARWGKDPGGHAAAHVELVGAGHRERYDRRPRPEGDQGPPDAERPKPAGRTAHGPLRHLDEDSAVRQDGPSRCDVPLDADAAAPDRQQPADTMDQPL